MTVDYLRAIQATEIGLRFENSEYSKWRASVRRRVADTCTYVRSRVDHVPVLSLGTTNMNLNEKQKVITR